MLADVRATFKSGKSPKVFSKIEGNSEDDILTACKDKLSSEELDDLAEIKVTYEYKFGEEYGDTFSNRRRETPWFFKN